MNGNHYEVECWVKLNGQHRSVTDNAIDSSLLFLYNDNLYLWDKPEDVKLVDRFLAKGKLSILKRRMA